jgi:hypothetical protein
MAATKAVSGTLREVWQETVPQTGQQVITTGIRASTAMLSNVFGVLRLQPTSGTAFFSYTLAVSTNGFLQVTITNTTPANAATWRLDIMHVHSIQQAVFPGVQGNISIVNGAGSPEFDVCAYGAYGNGVVDDQPAIQALIVVVEALGGGTIIFPLGKTFKLGAPLRVRVSHMHFKGGGRLSLDSAHWPITVIPTVGNVAAGILVWSGTSQRRYVDPLTPYNSTYDSALVDDVRIDNVEFYDTGSYSSGYIASRNAIGMYGVTNSAVANCRFTGIHSEAIVGDILWRGVQIQHNTFVECAHDGIAPVIADSCVFGPNVFRRVFQPFECSLLRSTIRGNIISGCKNNAIWTGSSSLAIGVLGTIEGNVITDAEIAGAGILVTNDTATSTVYEVNIIGNTIRGKPLSEGAQFIWVYAPLGNVTAAQGAIRVQGNILIEDAAVSNDWGSGIAISAVGAQPDTIQVDVDHNTLVFSTGHAANAISISAGKPRTNVNNNTIHTTTALRAAGDLGTIDGVITYGLLDPDSANCCITNNTVNLKRTSLNALWNKSTTGILATLGRGLVILEPSVPRTVSELDGNIGDVVWIRAANTNVTIDSGVYIATHTGAPVTLLLGQSYGLLIYDSDGAHYYAKGLGLLV